MRLASIALCSLTTLAFTACAQDEGWDEPFEDGVPSPGGKG
jgi:hypothetical protein